MSIKNDNNKLYYFSPFEQYSEDLETKEVSSINPEDNIELLIKNNSKLTNKEKEIKLNNYKEDLKQKLFNAKIEAKEYKKSENFKKRKDEIKEQIMNVPKEEFVMKNLNIANASYTNPWASNVFIPWWISSAECSWATPCYKQFQTTYNWISCWNWCAPTAVWIVFWYYDRNGYSDLVLWNAPLTNSYLLEAMIKSIWNTILTKCDNKWQWSTYTSNIPKAKQYAIDKWYKNTTSNYSWLISTSSIFSNVKTEINAWRPIIINTQNNFDTGWHSIVWFWYRNSTTTKVVRVNMWWWWSYTIDTWSSYYTSNIDQNLDAIYYLSSNDRKATSTITFKISN